MINEISNVRYLTDCRHCKYVLQGIKVGAIVEASVERMTETSL